MLGGYCVDIVLNQIIVDMCNVNFVEIMLEKGIVVCLMIESLDVMGVNIDVFLVFK